MTFELHIPGFDSSRLVKLSPIERRQVLLEQADLSRSSGPWISFRRAEPIFDAINAGEGIGYNASPLFGVLHHPAAWSDDPQHSLGEIEPALRNFAARDPQFAKNIQARVLPREKIRAYIAANIIEQFSDQLDTLQSSCQDIVHQKGRQIPGFDTAVSIEGRRLTVRFRDNQIDPCLALLTQRILIDQVEPGCVVANLPLNLSSVDFEFLADRLAFVWEPDQKPSVSSLSFDDDWGVLRDHRSQFQFHAHMLDYKRMIAEGISRPPELELDFVQSLLPTSLSMAEVVLVTDENWSDYRDAVARMQELVYEPARQTAIEKFDVLMDDEFGYGLLVLLDKQIAGMVFIGPLELFPEERGTQDDPFRCDRHTMYTLDLTIAQEFRGSLGKMMKQAITLMTVAEGHSAIHGRNRDRLARGMWAINLGLGSFETRRLVNDYPDQQAHRDCIYYRCPLRWPNSVPLDPGKLDGSDGFAEMARIVND